MRPWGNEKKIFHQPKYIDAGSQAGAIIVIHKSVQDLNVGPNKHTRRQQGRVFPASRGFEVPETPALR